MVESCVMESVCVRTAKKHIYIMQHYIKLLGVYYTGACKNKIQHYTLIGYINYGEKSTIESYIIPTNHTHKTK